MASSRLGEIRNIRIEKLKKLRDMGVDPYPSKYSKPFIQISQALEKLNETISVAGRLIRLREHGNIYFADLRDQSGQIQLLFQKKALEDNFQTVKLLDIGDFIGVEGQVVKTHAGEITVDVFSLELLSKSLRPLPNDWHGIKDEETRYRQRYVDLLLSDDVRQVFLTRTKIVSLLRQFLDQEGFIEVETPVLQPIYGGTLAKPFSTHYNALDSDFFLRISDELYLKRLIVGGLDRVYEIGKDFRNEGIDRAHNPEFTMLEFYWAYADYEQLMKFTEKMLSEIVKQLKGNYKFSYQGTELDFTPPWPRITYCQAILDQSGIDIDKANTEEKLIREIKRNNIELNFDGPIGYGLLMDHLYKKTTRPHLTGPLFLTERPTEFVSLAKRKPDDETKTASFQLLVYGEEIMTAYNELNDPIDQTKRWRQSEELGQKGQGEHEEFDADYIRALEYGMPPTAGWGMGIDRLTAILTNQPSLKDTILFPTLRPESNSQSSGHKQDFDKKFVVIIDSDLPEWKIMNTSSHIAAFLGNKMSGSFDTGKYFTTKDGANLPRNSQYPIITLSATKNQLKQLMLEVRNTNLLHIGYVPEMMDTTNDKKLAQLLNYKTDAEVEYAGVGIFGPKSEVDNLTKKFPLWGKEDNL